jgi:hypothetical protein
VDSVAFDYNPAPGAGVEWLTATQKLGSLQAIENSDVLADQYAGRKFTVGYIEKRGKGRIIVIGLDPNPALVNAVHKYLGIPTYAQADTSGVHTGLLRNGSTWYIAAANLAKEERKAIVSFSGENTPSGRCRITDMWTRESYETTIDGTLLVALEGKSGNAWKIESL